MSRTGSNPIITDTPLKQVAETELSQEFIPFAKVDCSGNEYDYVREVMESGWLTTASKALRLEENFKERVNCRFALAVNSCTSALHLGLDAVGVKPGDKVFVPSMTFTASAEVIRYLGADPVLIDVDFHTANINSDIVRKAIKDHPDVKYLVAVHFGGLVLDMEDEDNSGILDICRQNGIKIVEDAAHALPAKRNNRYVGSFGDVTCFSFYANKTMTTGEGGMVTTNNEAYARQMKIMRLHGINRDAWDRYNKGGAWEYDVVAPGFKYNMPDLNAAVGLAQFERLDAMHAGRLRCAEKYFEQLNNAAGIVLPLRPERMTDHAWHLFSIKISPELSISRNEVIEEMLARGIGTSVHYKPLHQLSYYKDRYSLDASDYPQSEALWQQNISMPIYNLLDDEQVVRICDTLKSVIGAT